MKDTEKIKIKWWFVVVSAIYHFTIVLNGNREFTYVYYYGIPFLAFALNIKWCINKLKKLLTYELIIFSICYCFIFIAAVAVPVVQNTYDFSYFLDGPITNIIKLGSSNMFLLLLYEKKVTKNSSICEYLTYYVFAVMLYILITIIICLFPAIRIWISQNIYYEPGLRERIFQSNYYTRIGWSGFSGFGCTLRCTLAIICSYIFIFKDSNNGRNFWKWNICVMFLLIGNMCYGRSGLAISLLCIVLGSIVLYRSRCKKLLFYFPAGAVLAIVAIALKEFNARVKIWYDWSLSFIINFITTGEVNDSSFNEMLNMYFLPKFGTILFGDGRYVDGEGYYMKTDIGFIRPVLFYGIFFTCIGYIACCHLIIAFKRRLSFLSHRKSQGIMFMLFLTLIIFELKGEIYHNVIAFLLPLCLMNIKQDNCNSSGGM